MSKMCPVVHFEMPTEDRQRMAKFYQDAFGWQTQMLADADAGRRRCWQTQMLGEEMGNYVIAMTTETDENGPKRPGAINGGFFQKRPDWPAQYPSVVIAVDDIRAAVKKVAQAGGEVLGEPMEIPGVGQYVSFFDTEGNRVSMLQPNPRMQHAPKSE
jgi:predicted enzyme related to lactoylglutathione lyase